MPSFSEISARARLPSITSWTRLEPRPRDATMARSLQAQVRDPLWMLTRQWQLGEYAGTDAGSPVQATMGIETQTLTGYRAGPPGGTVTAYDSSSTPLELRVESESIQFNLRGAIQLGQYFEALVRASGVATPGDAIAAFRAAFPIAPTDPMPALAGQTGLQLRALAAGKVTDGEALYRSALAADAGGTPNPPLPPQSTDPKIASALAAFVDYRKAAFLEPSGETAWQANQLDYAFAVESAADAGLAVLEAPDFGGGHLDWYDFSVSPAASTSEQQTATYSTFNFLPLHVTFRGMPEPRWWNFEDSATDFGQLDTEHVDLAKMLVMEFALVYGGDWFFVPVPAPIGSLQRLTTLIVTDTFGERSLVRPVEQIGGTSSSPWTMFRLSGAQGPSDFILIPPTLGLTDDAEPLEDVIFLRDNAAAMAWGIEQRLQGAADLPVDGYEQYLARLRAQPPATPPTPTADGPQISYVLEQPVPDNWIPLVPVLNNQGELLLRRGTMDIPDGSGGVIKLTAHGQILEPWHPFYLTERVVTQIGVEVSRSLRRTRWVDGATYVWMGRQSGPGRGPGWSGLRFDFVQPISGK